MTHDDPISDAIIERRRAFGRGSEWAKFLACTRQSAIIIGSWLFVHASITKEVVEKHGNIQNLNQAVRQWLVDCSKDNIPQIIRHSEKSPFWNRLLGKITPDLTNQKDCTAELEPVLEVFKNSVKGTDNTTTDENMHIIIGHTPQILIHGQEINSACGGKLYRADSGASKAFKKFYNDNASKSTPSAHYIEIINDTDVRILP